jgi:two-component system sensor histidine kinase UhpB
LKESDIENSYIAEEKDTLRDLRERFRATFEQAAVGIAHVAPDGTWLRVNKKLCEIVG